MMEGISMEKGWEEEGGNEGSTLLRKGKEGREGNGRRYEGGKGRGGGKEICRINVKLLSTPLS